jgi:protoheme IX farnesyltransferase
MSSVTTSVTSGRPDRPFAPEAAGELVLPLRTAVAMRLADYLDLMKPRIAVMVLITVMVGYTLGCRGEWSRAVLVPTLLGVGLVAWASSALNQYLERTTDGLMSRTAGRPLPQGRLLPGEVAVLGVVLGATGTWILAGSVNGLTAGLTLLSLAAYVGLYTPMKRRTSLCTAIGAIPGALPPVLGWTAARGTVDPEAWALFAVLFLWQFPHFLAIAWLYRDEYERAGLRMLPAVRARYVVGLLATAYALVLLAVSLWPRELGLTGDGYAWAAMGLGGLYVLAAARFARRESDATARDLLRVSLIYLPGVLTVMTLDHIHHLR